DDFVEHLVSTSTHDTMLFFTNKGKVYRAKGYEIPEFNRTAKGIPIINLLQIEKEEWINAVISVNEFSEDMYLFFTTRHGISKRSQLSHFANIRKGGLIAVGLREEDELISVRKTDGTKDIMIGTKNGYLIRFDEEQVRSMGRTAAGVRGISLRDDDEVVSMEILEDGLQILHVTNKGVGKRTPEDQYRTTNRCGKGILTCKLKEHTGHVVAVKAVTGEEDIMLITVAGVLIRIPIEDISQTGRNTQGVLLIRIQDEEEVATVAVIEKDDEEESETTQEEANQGEADQAEQENQQEIETETDKPDPSDEE